MRLVGTGGFLVAVSELSVPQSPGSEHGHGGCVVIDQARKSRDGRNQQGIQGLGLR